MKNQPLHFRLRSAWQGIRQTWQAEASFKTHSACLLLLLALLIWVQPSPLWWALLLLTSGLVLVAELFNTVLEDLMDFIHPDWHQAVKRIKDGAAGAVLLASLTALGVFACFLWTLLHKSLF